MFSQLPPEQIVEYANLFPGPHAALVVASIAAGNTAAQLWDLGQPPGAALLWDQGNNVFYLAGAARAGASCAALAGLVATELRPRALAAGRPYFKVRALAPQLEAALPAIFAGVALREAPTLFFGPPDGGRPAPSIGDIQLVPIDRALLTSEPANLKPVTSEIAGMWSSLERFYSHGFGCAALDGARVICWCTAEYASADRCGIGIATEPAYQRRGIATATAARFIQLARERRVAPHWECGAWNGASIRVAEKAGFVRVAAERYWIGTFAS
jgi:RimJ/RimL family protein N-acetyltransferase